MRVRVVTIVSCLIDPNVVNEWILQIGRDKMDPRDVAEDWVNSNMDVVNGWIN